MSKPWARIQVGYLLHPKFLALNANAICLWHEGKNYCDMHHTDGLIPRTALKSFRFRGQKAVELLTTSAGEKPDGTAWAPLWEVHTVGYKMHDYLDYNDCRDAVLARIEDARHLAELRKAANRDRQAKSRAARKERLEVVSVTRRHSDKGRDKPRDRGRDGHGDTYEPTETETELSTQTSPKSEASKPHPVRDFLAFYEAQFLSRFGEKPVISHGRDAKIAKTTLQQFGMDRAQSLLRAFFESSDPFIQKTGYGLNVFAGQINKLLTEKPIEPVQRPDEYGHFPPCKNRQDCVRKLVEDRQKMAAGGA